MPGISLLDLAVLGLVAGFLEQFLDINTAAFGGEDVVLADLLSLGHLLSQLLTQNLVV